jgi:hypothetical protein
MRLATYLRRLAMILVTLTVRTHTRRWKKVATAGPPPWDMRNEQIASMIPPGSSVIDLGCGAQTLKSYLPQGCFYQPCDLVSSTPDVIVCDFNEGQYPAVTRRFTHVVCSGVLEYVRDHRRFLEEASQLGDTLILSYNLRLPDQSRFTRMTNNWINHFSRSELESVFREARLAADCVHTSEHGEVIYRLRAAL